MAIFKVRISRQAQKDLRKVPTYIIDKLDTWIDGVERQGLEKIRKLPGYHDEPLLGNRFGQRSIRLNRAYRAIYVIALDGFMELVQIEEVSKHDY